MEFYPEGNNQSPEGKADTSCLCWPGESTAWHHLKRRCCAYMFHHRRTGPQKRTESLSLKAFMSGTRPLPVLGRERLGWRERAETSETSR